MQVSQVLAENSALIASKTAESSFHDVAKVLRDRKIDLLVLSGPGDKIFGMLSELDIVRVFADQWANVA